MATQVIIGKNWFLLTRYGGIPTINAIPGFIWGQVSQVGSDVPWEINLVMYFRATASVSITIDDTVYYLMYNNPEDIILYQNPDLA